MNEKLQRTIKEGVLNNKLYTLKHIDAPYKINQNESPYDMPQALKDEITRNLAQKNWNVYPEFWPVTLYEKIAQVLGVSKENILLGNGSNEMIFTLLTATLENNKKVIIPEPTFTVYTLISSNLNAEIVTVPLKDDLSFDIDTLCEEAASPGSVTVLCSPNNPTGGIATHNDIKRLVEISGGLVIVDEAYIQFGGETVLDLIADYPNLVILRTFSKVFGLAGLRIGMMIGHDELILEMSKVKLPYNLNIFTIITLETIADNMNIIEEQASVIIAERNRMYNELRNIGGVKVYPSHTNFLLIKVDDEKRVFNELLKEGILIRDVSNYPQLAHHLRISVGEKSINDRVIDILKTIM